MLRINVYSLLTPGFRDIKIGSSHDSWIIASNKAWRLSQSVSVRALKDKSDGETEGFPGQSWEPSLEIEVPFEQRPVNEYSSLKDEALYSWGELSPGSFFLRLGGLWLVAFTILGVPIAAASFNPSKEPLRFALAAGTGTLFLVSLIVLRIYLGWSYVGDRLLSAVIPYEESGWYDGQMWVKPPEVLARDRLLGSYKVKPIIKLLKQTLIGTGALLVIAVLLFTFATPVEDFLLATFTQRDNTSTASSDKTDNLRKEELLRLPVEVIQDDDLAAVAAEAAGGRPVYCRDRATTKVYGSSGGCGFTRLSIAWAPPQDPVALEDAGTPGQAANAFAVGSPHGVHLNGMVALIEQGSVLPSLEDPSPSYPAEESFERPKPSNMEEVAEPAEPPSVPTFGAAPCGIGLSFAQV
ncbi:hypothetical protein Nepgr_008214 [Nepenthes gracilis]|uniref:Ycf36 n=1 Tax=Nepenthes gracilis TaxID=150966 RepID=A0AAD3XJ24_NEPGR|nr:hypothetical protein Nepgr_008214 [Nepenthes gracilis]